MQIRTKLTYQFTINVALILILFSVAIYYFSSNYREQEFYSRLKDKAITTAKLLSQDVKEVNPSILKAIDRNSVNNLPGEKVTIYDFKNTLLYDSNDDSTLAAAELINKIRLEKEVRYTEGESEVIGVLFEGQYDRFVVIASAFDKYGFSKLRFLKYVLLIGVLITIVLTVITGLFFSKQALQPIANVVGEVDKITVSNLYSRVNEGNGTDEIAQLAIKFNKMLERLEAAFEMQRSFVSNASHELRTPLTSLTGQIEVSLMNDKINEDTKQLLKSLLDDIKNLNKLSNGLLDLAQASLDISEIKVAQIRIDELIGHARAELLKRNKNYKIGADFKEFPEEEKKLILTGSEQLLKAAIINIIENSCKYSVHKEANVAISFKETGIHLIITDKGIGIPQKDLEHIFEPFFRSENVKSYLGHGIGLTLTQRIIKLHQGEISINSELNKGTSVSIFLPY
ncbi:MAG: HAMP domain-containing protein [Bacteroidetes bacterium]|nr:HAMP domain-containing protein [Bacteroidota bacterium]